MNKPTFRDVLAQIFDRDWASESGFLTEKERKLVHDAFGGKEKAQAAARDRESRIKRLGGISSVKV